MKKRSRNKTRSVLSLIMSLALVLGMCTTSYAAEEIPDGGTDEEAVVETDTTVEDTLEEGIPAEDTPTEDTEGSEDITEDIAEETEEYPADEISGDEEYDVEVLSAEKLEDEEVEEDEETDTEIQVFASTEENQTLKVVQKAEGTIEDDVSFTYHLYQITEAEETIENLGDIISYEPGAYLDYVIVETESGEEISDGTTDSEGTFALHVGETAEFTLEAETDWFVTQETPEAYPLISVGSDGEYAEVVDDTNGVVYYGNIEPEPEPVPEPEQPVITGLTVASDLDGNEKTYDGGSVTLSAEVTVTPDTATVSYQWYTVDEEGNASEISGATESTYTLAGDVSDSGTYKCVVTAANDDLTAAAEAEVTVTINKAAQNISYAVTEMDKTLGDGPFTNVLTQTTVDGQITYTSSDEAVATVNPETGEVTILTAGEVTITATAVATENYTEATASYSITVIEQPVINEVTITSNLTDNEKTYDGENVILTAVAVYLPESAEISYMWYTVDTKGNETEISGATGSTLTLDGNVSDSGTYKCVVTVTNDGLTATDEAEITITINKAAQEISYADTSVEKLVGDDSFTNELTETIVSSEEGSGITYTSTDETVATVDPETGEVTILASGETIITATAAGTANYEEASASYTLTVREQPVINGLTITSNLIDNEKTYDGGEVILTANTDYIPDTATITYQWYTVDDEDNETEINGATDSTLTLDGNVSDSGTYKCVVTATNDGLSATDEAEISITINKADQDISYDESMVTKVDYDEGFINDLTQTIVDGRISYASGDESVATVDPDTGEVHIVGTGYTTITATAAETDNYEEASTSYVLIVNTDELEWEIDVNHERVTWDEEHGEWVDDLSYTGEPLELEMTITLTEEEQEELAGIAYQWYRYNADTQDFEEIGGATEEAYTLKGEDANAGDYIYMCVAVVTYKNGYEHTVYSPIEVIIEKADQIISYETEKIEKNYGEEDFINPLTKVTVDGEITYSSSDESVAVVDPETGEVTIVGIGEAVITATAAETDNYNGTSAGYTVTVTDAGLSVNVSSDLEDNTKAYDEDSVTLTAEAASDVDGAEFAYQWYDAEGNEIEHETGSTLTLSGNVADSGKYTCIVTVTYPNGEAGTASGDVEITIEKAVQSISYAETAVEKIDYDDPFINELTETLVYGDITYSFTTQMGDEPVIELDESTGEVSIKNIGVVVVTATVSGSDNYEGTSASYILTVNSDLIGTEMDVNGDKVDYDDGNKEYIDDLIYDGQDLELEIVLDLTSDELEHLTLNDIAYQWYSYDFELKTFSLINGATEDTYTLTGEDVNAGDYVYLCVAVVTYDNGYEHMVYSPIEVIIEKAGQSIIFEYDSLESVAGDTFTNEITENSVIVGTVTYTSDDDSVATVDAETGEVTIVGVGTVTITATAAETDNYNEASASYTITTTDEVSVTITSDMKEEDNTKTYDGEKVTLTAEASYKAENGNYTYQWEKESESGEFTAIAGATGETLTMEGNVADSGTYKCTVTVTYPNVADSVTADSNTIEITINKANQDISYGETEIEKTDLDEPFTNNLTKTTVSNDEGAGITYVSSDATIATVDENGLVTIVGIGEVTITATAAETANYDKATASYTLTVMKAWDSVQYAVKLWGICADNYSDNEGSTLQTASLTFGPATGADYRNSYVSCDSDTCIHKLSWDEIIGYCNQYQGDSAMLTSLFGSCLENGCTKAVELTPNEKLFNMTTVNNALAQGYTGDGVSTLYYLLNGTGSSSYTEGSIWNYSDSGYSGSDRCNVYSRSRIRATLTGDGADAKAWVEGGYHDYYDVNTLCNESNCLLSCFPANLQTAVVPRETPTSDDKTTYDKLFLFSVVETGAGSKGSGSNYGVNSNSSARVAYEFSGTSATASSSQYWWTRTRREGGMINCNVYSLNRSGVYDHGGPTSRNGLSPGFCIK